MKSLAFHILRKDVFHLRGLLTGWFLLLIAQSSLIGFGLTTGANDYFWQIAYSFLALGIPLAQGLLVMVLVPLLVHAEPLVGTTAYWFTRPIARQTLLGSKIAFVCLLLVVPNFVLQCLVLAVNRIPAEDIFSLVPEILIQQLGTLLFFAGFAVLTSGFASYALWVVVTVVLTSVLAFVAQMVVMWQSSETFFETVQNPTLLASRTCASGIFQILGGFAVVIHQYLTRETKRSVFQWVGVLVIASLISIAWPWDFLASPKVEASQEIIPADSVVVTLEQVSGADAFQLFSSNAPQKELNMRVRLGDVPPGVQLEIGKVTGSLQFESASLEVNTNGPGIFGGSWFWPAAAQHALGGIPILNARADGETAATTLLNLPEDQFFAISKETGTLNLNLELVAFRYVQAGAVPLESGQQIVTAESRVEIGSVLKNTAGCTLILRERRLNRWGGMTQESSPGSSSTQRIYFLVNRKENLAILPKDNFNADVFGAFQTANLLINRNFNLSFDKKELGERVDLSSDWLKDAELVVLDRLDIGTLERPLDVPEFLIRSGEDAPACEAGEVSQEE